MLPLTTKVAHGRCIPKQEPPCAKSGRLSPPFLLPANPMSAIITSLLNPKLDFVFKKLFASDTDLLADLINAIRGDEPPVVGLQIRNPQIAANELEGKHIVLDIWAQDVDGQQFDIEMQASKHSGWNARSVYYLARSLGEQLRSGEGYHRLQPVIGIHLLDFDLFQEPEQAFWEFEMRDRRRPGVVLDRCLQLNMVELPKADLLRPHLGSILAQWITFFVHFREEHIMQQIQHPPVQKAYQHLHALSADEQVRQQAFVRERALRDAVTEKSSAKAELVRDLMQAKFGELPSNVDWRIQHADESQLTQWGRRILFAGTLEEVFSDH